MESKDVPHIQICQLLNSIHNLDRYKVGYLGQSIYNHPDRVMAFRGSRQTHDKVHGYAPPLPHGYIQGFQQFGRFLVLGLDLVAGVAPCDTSLFMFFHQNNFLKSAYIFVLPG
jgi:hypothetical protein